MNAFSCAIWFIKSVGVEISIAPKLERRVRDFDAKRPIEPERVDQMSISVSCGVLKAWAKQTSDQSKSVRLRCFGPYRHCGLRSISQCLQNFQAADDFDKFRVSCAHKTHRKIGTVIDHCFMGMPPRRLGGGASGRVYPIQ
jgi:hypothetical protein